MKPESATVKPEAMVSSTPIALAAGSAIAVTPEESSAGVESVTIVCAGGQVGEQKAGGQHTHLCESAGPICGFDSVLWFADENRCDVNEFSCL